MRRRSGDSRSLTSPLSFSSLASSQIFCLPQLSSLSARRWLAAENLHYLVTSWIRSVLVRCKLRYFCFRMSQDSGGQGWISWTELYLSFPWGVWKIFIFQRKGEAKNPKEASLCLKTRIPYSLWWVVERSTPIGLHVPPRHNFLGYFPAIFWSCKCSVPIFTYNLLSNHVWTRRPR